MKGWEESVLIKAIEKYGVQKQTDKAIEEMSELTKALLKYRQGPNIDTKADIIEELADVEIMCKQLRLMNDYGKVNRTDKMVEYKLKRLEDRMEANNEKSE